MVPLIIRELHSGISVELRQFCTHRPWSYDKIARNNSGSKANFGSVKSFPWRFHPLYQKDAMNPFSYFFKFLELQHYCTQAAIYSSRNKEILGQFVRVFYRLGQVQHKDPRGVGNSIFTRHLINTFRYHVISWRSRQCQTDAGVTKGHDLWTLQNNGNEARSYKR